MNNLQQIKEYLITERKIDKYTVDRFWSKVNIPDDLNECCIWLKQLNPTGYGVFSINSYPHVASRCSYSMFYGDIPEGLCVLHKCDNRPCVNPSHLFLGTRGDNNRDRSEKGRSPIGEKNGNSVMTEEMVIDLLIRINTGELTHSLEAEEYYDVSKGCIRNILVSDSWKVFIEKITKELGLDIQVLKDMLIPKRIGSLHHSAVLIEEEVIEIKRLMIVGHSNATIARKFNVSKKIISRIKTGRTWKHIQ